MYRIDLTDQEPDKLLNAVITRDKDGKVKYNSGHIRFYSAYAQHEFASKCFDNDMELVAIRNVTPHDPLTLDEAAKLKRKGLTYCPYCDKREKWKNDHCPVCGMSIENFYVKNANHLWNSKGKK